MPWSRPTLLSVALVAGAAASFAQSPSPSTNSAAHESLNPEATNAPDAIGAVTHFDPASLDRSVQPCDDFYQFSCGTWLAKNPVPADRSRWDRLDELTERNQHILRAILDKAASPAGHRGTVDQKIGDYYASCMDAAAIDAKGIKPLQGELDRIRAIKTKKEIAAALARLHADDVDALFRFGPQPDFRNASTYGAAVDQAGTALPDRDYYLLDDKRFLDIRKQYPGHVQRMLELLGEPKETAARDAQTVLDIETALARIQLDRVKRRDPKNRDHRLTRAELAALAPDFDWSAYFAATGAPAFADLNVGWPDFFKGMNELLDSRSLDDWKAYLRWQTVHGAAPFLPAAFVNENFNFFDKTLRGTKELRPRWKRCVELTNRQLGEALGQPYVAATFGPEGKERMSKMVVALESALDRDIQGLPWMTDATKKRALEKRAAIANKIGYPDHWRDYSKLNIVRGDAFGNGTRAIAFENTRNMAKIGRKVDPSEWTMTPPTVNANYSPFQNNVNFPAGILQPPFFDKTMDDAVNFGAIGSAIGHELTHGFDDQGRKFDAKGNLTDWWTAEDAKEFEQRATCLADEYTAFTVVGDTHLNGRLTLGENTADNGGVRISYMALEATLKGKEPALRDGFTPEQRFFLGWGQTWCDKATDENSRLRAQTDSHSPGHYRVNGVMQNMPEFQKAWNCAPKAPMVRENACRVW